MTWNNIYALDNAKIIQAIFSKYPDFKEYYFQSWYDESDFEQIYGFMWDFSLYIKKYYFDDQYNCKVDSMLVSELFNYLVSLSKISDSLFNLVLVWFFENLLVADKLLVEKLLTYIDSKDFQDKIRELYNFWYLKK